MSRGRGRRSNANRRKEVGPGRRGGGTRKDQVAVLSQESKGKRCSSALLPRPRNRRRNKSWAAVHLQMCVGTLARRPSPPHIASSISKGKEQGKITRKDREKGYINGICAAVLPQESSLLVPRA